MEQGKNMVISALAGAAGGALVLLLVTNSPPAVNENGSLAELPETESVDSPSPDSLVVQAVEKANPAVVSIVVTKDVPIIERYYDELPKGTDPFGDFFGGNFFSPFSFRVPQYRQKGTEKKEVGGGSGFLISADGLIVTNKHVVEQDDVDYTVFMNDGQKYDAVVVARDPSNDLAVIKISGGELPYLELGNSGELKAGQTVIAIGNALAEFRNTVSVGVISGLARSITAGNGLGQSEQLEGVIQTDAAINPGNSGGPLLDLDGKVVGVNVAMAQGSENIGFSLPIDLVKGVIESVKETGRIVRPYIGIRYTPITKALQEVNKLSVNFGVLVVKGETPEELAVIPGSPANKAGIEEGDIILEIDGAKLTEANSLAKAIARKKVGESVKLKILHKGEEREVSIVLEESP
ncbi:MAG: trypsin-like peptidase domain-containing protein [bacterium]